MNRSPRVFGVAGGGLSDASWARNEAVAKVGQAGERKTADLLDPFTFPVDGVTVLHDLRIPIPGFSANVDHVVVSGRTVHIVDSKMWRPARYWTFRGKTRRGWERFEAADKQTMRMAHESLERFLEGHDLHVRFATPVVVVWPSSPGRVLDVRWLRVPGAVAIAGDRFGRYADKHFKKAKPADARVVSALRELVN